MQTVQMNVGNNSYLQPSKKSDDDVKLEEKAVNSLEYQKKVKDLEKLIQELQQQENDSWLKCRGKKEEYH